MQVAKFKPVNTRIETLWIQRLQLRYELVSILAFKLKLRHLIAAGTRPGLLYRTYPGPWRVFRAVQGGGMECVAEYKERRCKLTQ